MTLQILLKDEQKAFEEFIHRAINLPKDGMVDTEELFKLIDEHKSFIALHDQKIITAVIEMCEERKNEGCRTDLSDNPNSPEAWVRGKVYGRNEALDDLQQALKKEMI